MNFISMSISNTIMVIPAVCELYHGLRGSQHGGANLIYVVCSVVITK